MRDLCCDVHGVRVLNCPTTGTQIRTDRDAVDLIATALEHRASLVVIPVERLAGTFFDLKTRTAGEILQKFVTYGVRVAVIGDISCHLSVSSSLRDFVSECNGGANIWFVADINELDKRLELARPDRTSVGG